MAKERAIYDWRMTSAVLAVTLNVHRAGGEAVPIDAFVPKFEEEPEPEKVVITDPEEKRALFRRFRAQHGG